MLGMTVGLRDAVSFPVNYAANGRHMHQLTDLVSQCLSVLQTYSWVLEARGKGGLSLARESSARVRDCGALMPSCKCHTGRTCPSV